MKISVSKGLTINLGNFESYRCDVTYEVDVGTEYETTGDAGFEHAKKMVDQRLNELMLEAQNYKAALPRFGK